MHCDLFILPLLLPTPTIKQLLWVPDVFFLRATRSFVGRGPTRRRLSAEDTSGKPAIRKDPLFARVTFHKLTEARNCAWKAAWKAWLRKSKTSSRTEASESVLLPVSLCRVQVTESLTVKRCDLFWASSSLVFKDWFYQRYRFFISILLLNPYSRNSKDIRPQGSEKKQTRTRGQKTRQTTFRVKFAFVHSLLYRIISHGTQAPSTRIRRFLYPQIFLCGYT